MQSKQSREEDVTDAARLELFQVLMSFSVGSMRWKKTQARDHQPVRAGALKNGGKQGESAEREEGYCK